MAGLAAPGYAEGMSFSDMARRLFTTPKDAAAAVPLPASAALPPPRLLQGRVEFRGMLWHPVLAVQDEERLVVSAKAGLPHCARCDKALVLERGAREVWTCTSCGDVRPGADVDLSATDGAIGEALSAFLCEHPGYAAAEGLVSSRS